MWKRIDELLSQSEKHARLTPNAMRVWLYTLIHSDTSGVFPANAQLIKSQCMPLLSTRLDQVDSAIQELASARLVHLFDSGSKRYLVFHDHEQWNPATNLRNQKGTYPSPPSSLCPCIPVRDEDAPVPSAPVSSPSRLVTSPRDEVLRQLFQLAQSQKIAATEATLRGRLDSWVARLGAQDVQAKLMDKSVVGLTVNEIQDLWFPKVVKKALAPAPRSFKCGTCNDDGFLTDPRTKEKSPCSCVRRAAGA